MKVKEVVEHIIKQYAEELIEDGECDSMEEALVSASNDTEEVLMRIGAFGVACSAYYVEGL